MFDCYKPILVGGANLKESGRRCFNDKYANYRTFKKINRQHTEITVQ